MSRTAVEISGVPPEIMDRPHHKKPYSVSTAETIADIILENVVEGYWDWDVRTDSAILSPRYCELLGYPPETVFNSKRFIDSIHPDDLGAVARVLQEYQGGHRDRSEIEFRILRRDGYYIWVRERAKVVTYDGGGRPLRLVGSVADITASKNTEAELLISKARLNESQRQAHLGSWTWDPERDSVEWSEELYRIFGLDPGQPAPSYAEHSRYYTEESRERLNNSLNQIMVNGTPFEMDIELVRPDGFHRHCFARVEVEQAETGKISRLYGTFHDITELRLLGRELSASHALLHNLSEQVPGALFQTRLTPDGHFSTPYASRGLNDIYGLAPEAVVHDLSALFATFHPDERDTIIASIMESARSLQPWEHEYRVLLPSGLVKWLRGHARPMKLADGSILWHGIITDISERKALEATLTESEARYRKVFEVESDALFLVSLSTGKFIDANRAASEIYGYRREELIGMGYTEVSAEPELTRLVVEGGKTYVPLRWHRRKDGTVFPVEISGSYFDFHGDRVNVAAIRDISERLKAEKFREEAMELLERQVRERTASLTAANEQLIREIEERKRTEAELLDHQQRLETLGLELSIAEDRERGRIAGELHDQVGQCLVLGKIKANSLAAGDLPPEQRRTVEELERLLENAIDDIRSLTFQLRPPILVTAGLEAAVQWLAEELKEHYALSVTLSDDHRPKPLSYELRSCLFQAVRELLLNVAKHAGTGRAQVTFERGEMTITIVVADEGVGFAPEEALLRTTRAGGFGLFNLQQRVQYLGGRFTMQSAPGKGSRATIIAPLLSFEAERAAV